MAEQNGDNPIADSVPNQGAAGSSPNGYGRVGGPEPATADRPELLLGAAVLGGLLLAGVVSRLGR